MSHLTCRHRGGRYNATKIIEPQTTTEEKTRALLRANAFHLATAEVGVAMSTVTSAHAGFTAPIPTNLHRSINHRFPNQLLFHLRASASPREFGLSHRMQNPRLSPSTIDLSGTPIVRHVLHLTAHGRAGTLRKAPQKSHSDNPSTETLRPSAADQIASTEPVVARQLPSDAAHGSAPLYASVVELAVSKSIFSYQEATERRSLCAKTQPSAPAARQWCSAYPQCSSSSSLRLLLHTGNARAPL